MTHPSSEALDPASLLDALSAACAMRRDLSDRKRMEREDRALEILLEIRVRAKDGRRPGQGLLTAMRLAVGTRSSRLMEGIEPFDQDVFFMHGLEMQQVLDTMPASYTALLVSRGLHVGEHGEDLAAAATGSMPALKGSLFDAASQGRFVLRDFILHDSSPLAADPPFLAAYSRAVVAARPMTARERLDYFVQYRHLRGVAFCLLAGVEIDDDILRRAPGPMASALDEVQSAHGRIAFRARWGSLEDVCLSLDAFRLAFAEGPGNTLMPPPPEGAPR